MDRRQALRASGLAALLVVGTGVAFITAREPSLQRTWDDDVRVLAGVDSLPDGGIRLSDVRDWSYTRDSIVSKEYFDAIIDPADVSALWLYEQHLDGLGLIAHTFLVFEMEESYGAARYLGLSVETRREVGEEYSIIGGMLRSFEVTHIWATEEDLVRRRVEYLDYPLRRYRVTIPEDFLAPLFVKMAMETEELAEEPRWYNTALNNCTSSLIRYVNESRPDAIPLHYSYVFTGRIDEYLELLGYVDRGSAKEITREMLEREPLR